MEQENTPSDAGEALAAVDEANLVLDHFGQVNVFLAAILVSPGGFVRSDGTADLTTLRASIAARVAEVPALRKFPVGSGHHHRWHEATPDLERHVRQVTPVDGIQGLELLCAQLMSEPLDTRQPLWELLVVPLSRSDRVGIVLRMHHAIADGIAAVDIAERLFDAAPGVVRPRHAQPPAPAPPLIADPATAAPARSRRSPLARALGKLLFGAERIAITLTGSGVGPTVLLGERDAHRGVIFVDVGLAALTAGVAPLAATVNDGLLAAVAAGYRAVLSAAGEQAPESLPVSVPVALRRRGASRNQVGIMLINLPLAALAPTDRVTLIARQTGIEKPRARAQGTLEFMRGPLGARLMDRLGKRQHVVAGFVTNVPGPAEPQRLAGAPVGAIWPVTVLAANVRLGVAALSYAGRLYCGIHFDAENVSGAAFARAMSDELERLESPSRR